MALIDSIFIKIKNSLYNVSIPKSVVMSYKKIVFLIFSMLLSVLEFCSKMTYKTIIHILPSYN